jgi:hypothetical protein
MPLSANGAASSSGGPTCDFVFRRQDPAPFLWELKTWLAQALGRR